MDIEKISMNEYKLIFHNGNPTIGNLLQKELLKDRYVNFVGYYNPHPMETKMILTVITTDKNPKEVITNSINNIIYKLDNLENEIKSLDKISN